MIYESIPKYLAWFHISPQFFSDLREELHCAAPKAFQLGDCIKFGKVHDAVHGEIINVMIDITTKMWYSLDVITKITTIRPVRVCSMGMVTGRIISGGYYYAEGSRIFKGKSRAVFGHRGT
ncbi:MAG: hypothetical protein Q4C61_16715 [Lachnospiraceae bacterium]|nr:hypothetical protein [Lachnospiraceae bacterium]